MTAACELLLLWNWYNSCAVRDFLQHLLFSQSSAYWSNAVISTCTVCYFSRVGALGFITALSAHLGYSIVP